MNISTPAEQALAHIKDYISKTWNNDINPDSISLQSTKPEFDGDYTLVTFAIAKHQKTSPDAAAQTIGENLLQAYPDFFTAFNVIKGFLNLTIAPDVITHWVQTPKTEFYITPATDEKVMIEYSSPNTNKPIHFGHLRNNFLGYAVAEIFKANGVQVIKSNLINDRGIHICKSMLAWQKWGNNETPENSGMKGDHLVGKYYVLFEKHLMEEVNTIWSEALAGNFKFRMPSVQKDFDEKLAAYNSATDDKKKDELQSALKTIVKNHAPLMDEARDMLVAWEANDAATVELWHTMNNWVYTGFDATYKNLGVDFDKMYYESETYHLGKEMVLQGLADGYLTQEADGSIWVNLEDRGMDKKILLRSDGTTVYMTQDIGTAKQKFQDYPIDQSIYVIGDEQNYHMKVLEETLEKLQQPFARKIYHLSYGMVELPHGKMKSREGTVVDADDMIHDMTALAQQRTEDAGKALEISDDQAQELYKILGLGAIKFYLLRVNPKKRILFNPEESIDLQGFTATSIQYTHARICSIFRNMNLDIHTYQSTEKGHHTEPIELEMILKLSDYKTTLRQAKQDYDPSIICVYIYEVAKLFNSFYDKCHIAKEKDTALQSLRLDICKNTADTIRHGMLLLGITVPERM